MIAFRFAWAVVSELVKAMPAKVWFVLSCAAALFVTLWYVDRTAEQRGRNAERAAAVVEAGKRIVNMEKSNAEFRNLPAVERCRALLRDSGLPLDECDKR